MRTFGLTGGIGSGKSTVARLLRERHGVPVVDADDVARAVVAPGSEGLAAVVAAFGPTVLAPDGSLDRAAMRARIVQDPDARRTLEGITHPRIAAEVVARLGALREQGCPLAAVEAALMVETGSWRAYDALVVVSARPQTQVRRVMARDGSSEQGAQRLVALQLPLADKVALADFVVSNDGDLDELERAVDDLVPRLRSHAPRASRVLST